MPEEALSSHKREKDKPPTDWSNLALQQSLKTPSGPLPSRRLVPMYKFPHAHLGQNRLGVPSRGIVPVDSCLRRRRRRRRRRCAVRLEARFRDDNGELVSRQSEGPHRLGERSVGGQGQNPGYERVRHLPTEEGHDDDNSNNNGDMRGTLSRVNAMQRWIKKAPAMFFFRGTTMNWEVATPKSTYSSWIAHTPPRGA